MQAFTYEIIKYTHMTELTKYSEICLFAENQNVVLYILYMIKYKKSIKRFHTQRRPNAMRKFLEKKNFVLLKDYL